MDILVGRCLLQNILDQKKVSRTQLMDRTGMSKQQISNYINGEQTMSLKTAIKISYVLNCRVLDLYDWQIID